MSLSKASIIHIVILTVAAAIAVVATLAIPQKAYTPNSNSVRTVTIQCGKPFNFVFFDDTDSERAFPYTTSCLYWNPLEEHGDIRMLLFMVNALLVFAVLYIVTVLLPRVIVRFLPFMKTYDGSQLYTVLLAVVATAVIVSSHFIVKINDIQIVADNQNFSHKEAIKLAQAVSPSLVEYDGSYKADGVVKFVVVEPGEREQWLLQFVEENSDRIVQGHCYLVEYSSTKEQVIFIDSFLEADIPVYELDSSCQPRLAAG